MSANLIPGRLGMILVWAALFVSALGVVWSIHETRTQFIELQSLHAERDRLDIEWSQLKIEQSAWATHGRVEHTARTGLNMVIPTPQEVQLVQP
jgi:cell division protein FtsL